MACVKGASPQEARTASAAAPAPASTPDGEDESAGGAAVEAVYYTDPLCSWSWAFEPQLRRLRFALGGRLAWRTRMGGLLPDWSAFEDPLNGVSRPLQMGPLWYEVRHRSGQPVDDRLWLEDPPASSFPACLAVKAAGLQSDAAADRLLRRLREAALTERRNVARRDVLLALAEEVAVAHPAVLDAGRLAADLDGEAARTAFRADLQEARYLGITRFPALTLRRAGEDGRALLLVGWRPYDALLRAVRAVAPEVEGERQAVCPGAYRAFWGGATDREVEEGVGRTTCGGGPCARAAD